MDHGRSQRPNTKRHPPNVVQSMAQAPTHTTMKAILQHRASIRRTGTQRWLRRSAFVGGRSPVVAATQCQDGGGPHNDRTTHRRRPLLVRWHGGGSSVSDDTAPTVQLTFLQPDGVTKTVVPARVGETLLQAAHRHGIDLEGACEGVCACSTCHLILPVDLYDRLPEPSEDEEDMLDMAFGLSETSRLGCQLTVTPDMDGIRLDMPSATRNFYVDGHVPKPH